MQNIKEALIQRDNITEEEAAEIISDLRNRFLDGENPEDLLDELGLEMDYVEDLFDF